MFVVLNLTKCKKNRLINFFKKSNYKIDCLKIDNGRVFIVDIFKPNKLIWDMLKVDLEKLNGKIIIENNLEVPSFFKLCNDEEFLVKNMLYNSLNIIKKINIDIKQKNIVFYDINGSNSDFLKSVVLNVNRIMVVTAKTEFYNNLSKQYFEDYGVVISVKSEFKNLDEYKIMILTSDVKYINYKGIVISNNYNNSSCICINNFNYELPLKYSVFNDFDIDKNNLLSCLYSHCKSYELEKIQPFCCNLNNQKILFKDIYNNLNLLLK